MYYKILYYHESRLFKKVITPCRIEWGLSKLVKVKLLKSGLFQLAAVLIVVLTFDSFNTVEGLGLFSSGTLHIGQPFYTPWHHFPY